MNLCDKCRTNEEAEPHLCLNIDRMADGELALCNCCADCSDACQAKEGWDESDAPEHIGEPFDPYEHMLRSIGEADKKDDN